MTGPSEQYLARRAIRDDEQKRYFGLMNELLALECATNIPAARFIADGTSPWFDDALHGLIVQKVGIRRVVAALNARSKERRTAAKRARAEAEGVRG